MQAFKICANWANRQVRRNNPEYLWVHYALALSLIAGVFIATHLVNRTIISHSEITARSLKAAETQLVAGQSVMLAAENFIKNSVNGSVDLDRAIAQFAQAHASLPSIGRWSPRFQEQYFSGDTALDLQVENFLLLAKELSDSPAAAHAHILDELRAFYYRTQLMEKQQEIAKLIKVEADAHREHLNKLQWLLLSGSMISLLGVAVFIFLPAQITISSAIAELRHKSDVLRRSKVKLADMNRKLEHLANHDQLTGLPNRGAIIKHLDCILQSNPAAQVGILFIGLDHFKSLNDTAGHDFGDAILRAVADRFASCIDVEDMVASIHGDEFAVVTSEPPQTIAARLMNSLAEPITVMGRKQPVNASIGYLAVDTANAGLKSLMTDAGIALQAAKNAGGNRIEAFTPRLRAEIEMIQKLQQELPEAIASGQIEPWFQPQIRLSDGSVHGAEVLARWRHPTHGLLAPDKFLPAATRAGLMIDLDHAIWKSAMNHVHDWQVAGDLVPQISLNAAPQTIADPNLIERFLLLLHISGLCSDQIIMEVLETTIIDGIDDMAFINIDSLAECGISLELDDFGTGYASLSKLTQLPLAGIKLDRSLVAPLPDATADSVVRAILALAVELDLQVVAEGIEQCDQAETLNAHGCAIGQGYGFARPMSADDFHRWLRDNKGLKHRANNDTYPFPKRA